MKNNNDEEESKVTTTSAALLPSSTSNSSIVDVDDQDDLAYARSMYLELIEDSREAIKLMKELTYETGHPRSAEVLATTIKTASDITDRFVELKLSKKKLQEKSESKKKNDGSGYTSNTTNNNLFLSTADLQKHLSDMTKVIDESDGY